MSSCACCKKPMVPIKLKPYEGETSDLLDYKLAQSKNPERSFLLFYREQHLLIHHGKAFVIETDVADLVNYFGL